MSLAGQTINDRLLAARHSLAGQGLAKSVCKATTEELIAPKKKHLDYLVHCTNEPNVSIPHLANLLIERSQNTNWIVVYKALLTTHHLLAYGNERFIQYLASSNTSFNLGNFLDKGGVQGAPNARLGYDMSPFIRRYAKYLNEKALSYRAVAFDFCKVKRGKEEGSLRTMNTDKLLKTLPTLQAQLDSLLEFDCQANDLTNGVINLCFMLLFRDLIRLFACYNDGIINLLEKYFDMNKKQAKDALDLYKRFLVRMDKVGEFLKVAENVGIDKGDIPDLTKAPSSLLDALEQHLANLEGRKVSAANTPTQSASNPKNNIKSGVSALSSTSSSFGTAATSTKFDAPSNGIDESIKAQALAEEAAAMNEYKSKVSSPTLTNPFLSTPPASQANTNIVDLFGSATAAAAPAPSKASDDLLQLGNPFADMFGSPAPAAGAAPANQGANNIWMNNNGFNGTQQSTNAFVSDSNFSTVFGNTEPSANEHIMPTTNLSNTLPNPFFDNDDIALGNTTGANVSGQVLQQTTVQQHQGFDALGDVLKPSQQQHQQLFQQEQSFHNASIIGQTQQPQQQQQQQQQQQPGKILTGDLDSSLASLVDNLGIKSGSKPNWNSPKNQAKPGANWQPQPMAATTGANYRPMAQGMTISPAPSTINHQFVHPSYPVLSNYFQQTVPPMMPPGMMSQQGVVMSGAPGMMPMQMGMQQQMMPAPPGIAPGIMSMPQQSVPVHQSNGSKPLDPFSGL